MFTDGERDSRAFTRLALRLTREAGLPSLPPVFTLPERRFSHFSCGPVSLRRGDLASVPGPGHAALQAALYSAMTAASSGEALTG